MTDNTQERDLSHLDQEVDIRELALALLDDEEGINEQAFIILSNILSENEGGDITECVKATDGRFYLRPEDAEELRKSK